ncbi:LLM class flavin-dependent oxidoreductase [Tersicoccus sp. Bi-70]|uniref:LLM class flavin-dependent oxidoreductase n=1 Tax=Tersicoccus sp. Bi-70 TaxID=1897634 RepID=UPI0009768E17|nr:LLM class flavin-dependent oxidoreductase [Tersicoccus sp. Bi-70]OMH34336.1 alkane 1-monooxygenase [Tersicoccus sp. Bi-70]
MVALSILDLVPRSEGQDATDALQASADLAVVADATGYRRLWYAEHHNTGVFLSSATALLIGRAAQLTQRIRVGSGGVMLPNHPPLTVAEQFGTLAAMYGDRIDLGLGRAPGTDPRTAALLRRGDSSEPAFAGEIAQLQAWFGDQRQLPVKAGPALNRHVPLWVLGSSTSGAMVAGQLGLPYAAASHFSPQSLMDALAVYRQYFDPKAPTAQIDRPYAMAGVNVVVADTDDEAERQFTTHLQMARGIVRNDRRALLPPDQAAVNSWDPYELAMVRSRLTASAVGSPATVREQLDRFVATTGVDELMTVTYTHDPAVRVRSVQLLADAVRPTAEASAAAL